MLANPALNRPKHSRGPLVLASAVLALTLVVALACGWLMLLTVGSYYTDRVYPNVSVMGTRLGRLTRDEATARLNATDHQKDLGFLILRDGESRWSIPWSEAGMQLDVAATVQAAFAVGHGDQLSWRDQMWVWLRRHDVPPVFAADPVQLRRVLQWLAPSVLVPPTDATLQLPQREGDPVIALPGQPGRELDVEATLARMLDLANGQAGNSQVDLVFRAVPPHVADATLRRLEVEGMLNRRVVVSTYDVLTDATTSWTLGRADILGWLSLSAAPDGPSVSLDAQAIQRSLADLAAEMGDGFGFQLDEAAERVAAAFDAGGGTANLPLVHLERTYVVQSGDSLTSIAAAFGMTSWHVLRANPGLNPDWLLVGQRLTIPSQDELTPLPPVPGKRVVISTAEQRMRVYEDGEVLYDWLVSTGVAESPTHTGVFQVLDKEERAYASLWDLWMPHFVAVYSAGPGFENGVHGLPTLSSGRLMWEGLLGTPASYGCIVLGLEEAATFYQWAEPGVVVVIE